MPRAEALDSALAAPSAAFDAPALLDARGVAALLSVSVRHVRRMETAGELPRPVRLGRAVRWRRAELLDWLAAGCPDRVTWEARRK